MTKTQIWQNSTRESGMRELQTGGKQTANDQREGLRCQNVTKQRVEKLGQEGQERRGQDRRGEEGQERIGQVRKDRIGEEKRRRIEEDRRGQVRRIGEERRGWVTSLPSPWGENISLDQLLYVVRNVLLVLYMQICKLCHSHSHTVVDRCCFSTFLFLFPFPHSNEFSWHSHQLFHSSADPHSNI